MIKKLLSSAVMLLVVSPVAAGVLSQASVASADTTTSISKEKPTSTRCRRIFPSRVHSAKPVPESLCGRLRCCGR